MRLHLNKTLRAALIAAITVVGTTLPLAQAWDGGPDDDFGGMGHVYYLNNGKEGVSLTDTGRNSFVLTPNAANVTGEISTITTKDGASVRFTGSNGWHNDWQFSSLLVDTLKAGADGQGTVSVNTQQYNSARPASETTVSILAVSGTLGGVQNYGVLTLGASGSTINASGTLVNHEGATLTLNGTYSFDTSNANNYSLKQEGSATWTDVTNQQGFKKTSGSSYYIIKGATAGTGFQATTTTGATISEESTGTYYFTAGDVTDTTKFYVKKDAVTLEGVNGTGTFQVDKAGATVTVQNATYRVTTGNMNVNIVVNDGGVLETNHSGVNGFITGALTINAGGIMRIVGEHDAFGWGSKNQCVASLVMEGTSEKEARLELNQSTGNSATMVTDITMKGYSTITSTKQGGSAGFNTFGCNITASGVQNNIDVLDVRRNGVTVDVAKSGELTVQKLTINGSDHSASSVVEKQGEGTLHFTGETKAEGLNIQAGTVDISGTGELHALTIGTDGSLSITGGSTAVTGTNTISNTVSVTGGALALNGTFDLSGISHEPGDVKYYKDANPETEPTANGFAKATVEAQLISGNASSVTIGQDAVLTMDGVAVTYDSTTGKVVSNGELSLTTYYINENSETLSEIQAVSPTAAVTMAGGTTLNVDADMAAAITVKNGTGNVNISAGKTVTGTKNNITLAGAGTYALNSGTIALGNGTTLGQGWTGYVRISDFTPGSGQNLAAMGTSLELNGFKGWDTDKWSGTMTTNIKLTDSASNLAWVNGSFSSNTDPSPKSTFTGTWSGTGTFKSDCNSGKYIDFEYQGDISQWTGAFISTCNTDLIFSGNANAVNIDISKASGSLDLVVKNDATFSKSVAVDTLSVDASKSATFNGTATFGSVTQNAGAAITVGTEGALTIGGGSLTSAITNNGTVTFSGNITATGFEVTPGSTGLVDVNGATDSGNGFETTSGSSITIVNNGESAIVNPGDHTVTQDNVVYTIQADGTATTAAGGVDYETYFQTNGEVSVSAIQAAADKEHEVCMTAVVSDTGILNVDEGLGFISASGGEVNFIGEAAADMFFVTGDTKVSGLKDISIMSIDAGKTATMEDGLATGDVTFAATDGVKVTNTGEQAITYSLEQTDAKVTADTMTVDGDSGVEIANSLVVKEIVNNNAEGLLLLGNVADGVTLNAAGGDITLAGQTSNTVSVVDLNIAPNNTVMVDNGQEEGTVTVSGMLTGGDATLLANLTLVGGSTLDVNGGDTHALTLGSTLTFDFANSVGLVNLDDETIAALNSLAEGGELDLIVAIDSAIDPLNYGGSYDGMWYSALFNRADGLQGDYKVYANDGAFGLVKQSSVPEPTTGTLGLLALAALAARRRRKK